MAYCSGARTLARDLVGRRRAVERRAERLARRPPRRRRGATGGRRWPGSARRAGRPGRSAAHQRASTPAWSGTHCRLALANTRSWSPPDDHDPMSASRKRTRGPACSSGCAQHRRRRVDADHVARCRAARPAPPSAHRCRTRGRRPGRSAGARAGRRGPRTAGPARRRTSRTAPGSTHQPSQPYKYHTSRRADDCRIPRTVRRDDHDLTVSPTVADRRPRVRRGGGRGTRRRART